MVEGEELGASLGWDKEGKGDVWDLGAALLARLDWGN